MNVMKNNTNTAITTQIVTVTAISFLFFSLLILPLSWSPASVVLIPKMPLASISRNGVRTMKSQKYETKYIIIEAIEVITTPCPQIYTFFKIFAFSASV